MSLRACKECGHQVSSDAKVCPHCGKKQGTGTGIGCVTILGILIVLVMLGSAFETSLFENKKRTPEQASPPARQLFMPGDIARVSPGAPFLMPLTKEARDEEGKLSAANDQLGLRQMILAGKAVMVPGGTQVKVIDVSGILQVTCQVRVLEGEYIGQAGWIEADFLKK